MVHAQKAIYLQQWDTIAGILLFSYVPKVEAFFKVNKVILLPKLGAELVGDF